MQENFIQEYLKSIPYANKKVVYEETISFLRKHPDFACSTEQKDGQQVIQLSSVRYVGEQLCDMRILLPHEYPNTAPSFNLIIESTLLNQKHHVVINKLIRVEHTNASDMYIKLCFPCVAGQWQPEKCSISDAFELIYNQIAEPPLLKKKQSIRSSKNLERSQLPCLQQVVDDLSISFTELNIDAATIKSAMEDQMYMKNRNEFIERHFQKFCNGIQSETKEILRSHQALSELRKDPAIRSNVDDLIVLDPKERQKMKIFVQSEALADCERRITEYLKGKLLSNKQAYEDMRPVLQCLYDRSFEVRAEYLLNCD